MSRTYHHEKKFRNTLSWTKAEKKWMRMMNLLPRFKHRDIKNLLKFEK